MKSRLLLQIHDELLIETHLDEFEEVKEILQNEMMNAVSLRVPLNIDIEQEQAGTKQNKEKINENHRNHRGVGSGKSEILNILKNDYQAKVIQSDHVAHELMVPGAKSYDAIVQAFGNEILNEDQTINRPILGEIVFHDETKLSLLNSITHKNVDEEILSRIDQFGKEEPEGLLVIESALLVGAGYEKRFDQLWYIYTREEVRYERLKASRGYSDEKIKQMIEKQQKKKSLNLWQAISLIIQVI